MNNQRQGWTHLQRDEGSDFLKWLKDNRILQNKFNVLANALNTLLRRNVCTVQNACDVWTAIPAVLNRCNEQSTYEMPGAPTAYAWLHLPDRYIRTWLALEHLLEENCLPMGKYEVRALDIGTGPGPSAFAIHDFYTATVEFATLKQDERWRQPAEITCVEFDPDTNHFRHHLAEIMCKDMEGISKNVLAMCTALPDFGKLHPTRERRQKFQHLRNDEDVYYDEVENEWVSELRCSPDEAHHIAQSLHRYRLLAFSNFLTTIGSVKCFESNIVEILRDANQGTVLLVIGGDSENNKQYSDIYEYIAQLAVPAGFQLKVDGHYVSSANSELSDRIYQEGRQFYDYLKNLSPSKLINDKLVRKVEVHFENSRCPVPRSEIWAYRK